MKKWIFGWFVALFGVTVKWLKKGKQA